MIKHLLLIILLGISIDSIAQTDRQFVRDGNRLYHKKAYDKAEVMYRKLFLKIQPIHRLFIIWDVLL